MLAMSRFWNGLNDLVHRTFVGGLIHKVNLFAKAGQVHASVFLSDPLHGLGLLGENDKQKTKELIKKRSSLGVYPIGLTALVALIFLFAFLVLA